MKLQTGIRVEADVWLTYRLVCSREKQRPSRPIEDFLRIVVDSDSALSVLSMMREAAKSRVNGLEAYARVLLYYLTHGKFWISDRDDEVSVEFLLLEALKTVTDKDLRSQIEEALIGEQRSREAEKKAREAQSDTSA
jgi:hypothetical protein